MMLHGFVDSDRVGDARDNKSTSGCSFSLGFKSDIFVQQEAIISGIEFSRGKVHGNQHC
jgi:hypothetical protein